MIRALWLAACLVMGWAAVAHAQSCPTPNLLQNGTIADATQVMSNFNTLTGCTTTIMTALGLTASVAPFPLSTAGTYALTDSKNTAITADGGAYSGFSKSGITASLIYDYAIGPGNIAAPSYDAMRGVTSHISGSTVLDVNGLAGYVLNLNARSGSAQVSSALKGIGVCAANNASCWGIDTIVSDSLGTADATAYTGQDLFNEMDYNVRKSTTTIGFLIGGTWNAQPTSATGPTILKPVQAGACSGSCIWQYGFGTSDGAATNAFQIGAVASSGTSVNSQGINFDWFDSGGTLRNTTISAQPGGIICATSATPGTGCNFTLGGTSSVFNAPSNGGLQVNGLTLAAADSGANAFLCTGAGTSACSVGQASSAVTIHGANPLFPEVTTGTPTAYACFDTTNHLIKSATAC